jgi:GNAT acetyltransferase-like protein
MTQRNTNAFASEAAPSRPEAEKLADQVSGRSGEALQASNSIEIRVKGRWVAVPAADVNGNKLIVKGKWLRTAVVRGEEMMEKELDHPEVYVEKLKGDLSHSLKADIFTFTQKPSTTRPKYSYPFGWESIAAIQLVNFKGWWEGLPQETRKNVRRAQKRGVQTKISEFDDDLIRGIQGVNDDAPVRQGTANAYYGKSFDETKERYGEFVGRCDFVCAYSGDELIGFLHLVYRGEIASILNLTTKPSHFDKRPANALVAKAAEICDAKGISCVTYGQYNYGNKRDSPLRQFKIRNGFAEILVPRYFVPLTTWGRLCMKANLHRGLVGFLPHSAITVGVGARSLWYDFRTFLSRCSSTSERPNRTRQMERSTPPAGSKL